jgi:putative toxin-antitoxin system antitoxin component (TIGR02293 family)
MNPAENIARILGMRHRIASADDLRRWVGRGLPKRTLYHVVDYITEDVKEAKVLRDRLVPPATYKRRAATLRPEESEKVERIARVMALAETAFGSRDDARQFMHAPHPELGGDRPLDAVRSELGARLIEEILWRMEHGLPV